MRICKTCDEPMELIDMPEAIFTIPFTGGRFSIWDWNKKGYFCKQCAIDSENERYRDLENSIAESVGRQAYEEGLRDARG